jgi:LysM repeat protein
MADIIKQDRADARKAAEAKLAPGETLGDDGGDIPRFETSVDVVGHADVVPLIGPGIITTMQEPVAEVSTSEEFRIGLGPRDNTPGANYTVIGGDTLSGIASRFKVGVSLLQQGNPQLAANKLYVGQRIYVPGADILLTPSVTTTAGDARVAPGNTPIVDTSIIAARIDLRPAYLDGVIEAAETLAEISGSEIAKKAMDLVKAIRGAETKLDKAGKSDVDAYKSMVANLKVLVEGADFARTAQETIAEQLKPYLREGLEMSASTFQGVRAIQKYLGRLTRAAKIPLNLIGLVDDMSTMLDSSKDGWERASAAQSVAKLVSSGSLAKDFYWVTGFARNLADRVGNHYAYAAVSMLRDAARKVGDVGESLASVMGKWSEPIFKKVSQETGEKVAREWVEKIAFWAAERQSGRIATAVANRALAQLIGRGLKELALGPTGLALDAVQLEIEFITYLDREVRYGTTTFFSQILFGKMVNTLKTEVRAQPTSSMSAAEAAVRYFYGSMLGNARSDVKQGWADFAQRYLLEQRKWYAVNAGSAQALLTAAKPYDQLYLMIEIARVLQAGALRYIDEQFRKEFKQEPPA